MPDSPNPSSASGSDSPERKPVPERFLAAKSTLRLDRFMTYAIRIGGSGIIITVFGILVFIFWQTLPLFMGATVEERLSRSFADGSDAIRAGSETEGSAAPDVLVFGLDEWAELPFLYRGGREIAFLDLHGERGTITEAIDLPDGATVTAARYSPRGQRIALGTADGLAGIATIEFAPTFEGESRTIVPTVEVGEFYAVGVPGTPVKSVGYGDSGEDKLLAVLQDSGDTPSLRAVTLAQKRSLLGAGEITMDEEFDLSSMLTIRPERILVTSDSNGILAVSSAEGKIDYLFRNGSEFELRQEFAPFDGLDDPSLSRVDFIFGEVSIVCTSTSGAMRIFSLNRPEGTDRRVWVQTKEFPALPGPAAFFASSQRNKLFLSGTEAMATLRYATTESIRWENSLPYPVIAAAIDGKSENIAFLDDADTVHLMEMDDPHPEAGWKAFFGRIWYEGASEPAFTWQSTGGSDDFEPKLSMVPLIFGSLKGTLYALIFAVPIAVLAAIYTSQFLHWKVKRVVKPTMEIMASLPSVVLGFLAALWLAPILETRVPSVLAVAVGLPLAAMLLGWAWSKLPVEHRSRIHPGWEFLVFMPVLLVLLWGFWNLGPVVERVLFSVTDPATGNRIADFRLWWPEVTGTPYEQRNSVVVGFMMGFAVIPIIFTIAEDSLSNVPPSLVAASSALGASRWQVVRTVVLPIAAAGIFSAFMIGFGRAVGETMIMVMATGNTPIMEWNPFSGMRTLSANIAVELPEAPVHSTHYRTLFLGGLLLFILTFALNTVAELLRYRLREKFKLV